MTILNGKVIQKTLTSHNFLNKFIFSNSWGPEDVLTLLRRGRNAWVDDTLDLPDV